MSLLFPHQQPLSAVHRFGIGALTAVVAVALLLPGVLARGIVFHPRGKEVVLAPFAWGLFAVVFLFFFFGGQIRLLLKIPGAQGTERTQLAAIVGSVIVAGLFGMFYNLLLPSPFFHDFRYIWTGPLFAFFFAVVITYAVFRYKLFNPRAAVAELLVFTLLLILLLRVMLGGEPNERWIEGSILAAVSVVGVLLVRSVNSEIRQREVIERQKEAIERASAEKSEFMSFASHEIRNPVTAIRGYASLILEGDVGPVSPPVRETVAKISTLGDEVLALISQFLTKSKAELGQIAYETVEFDLAEVTRELAEGMRTHAEQKGLALRIRVHPGQHLLVRADITKVKEAIRNVIDNAIKYTRTGSVTVSATGFGNEAQVAVADTGVGIAPDAMPNLFKKFSRADSQNVNRHGSGIGLYLAKMFLEAQGGRVWAKSGGKDKGSTFYIELRMLR